MLCGVTVPKPLGEDQSTFFYLLQLVMTFISKYISHVNMLTVAFNLQETVCFIHRWVCNNVHSVVYSVPFTYRKQFQIQTVRKDFLFENGYCTISCEAKPHEPGWQASLQLWVSSWVRFAVGEGCRRGSPESVPFLKTSEWPTWACTVTLVIKILHVATKQVLLELHMTEEIDNA